MTSQAIFSFTEGARAHSPRHHSWNVLLRHWKVEAARSQRLTHKDREWCCGPQTETEGWTQERRGLTLHRGKEKAPKTGDGHHRSLSALCPTPCGFSQKAASFWKSSCWGQFLAARWPDGLSENRSDKAAEPSLEAGRPQPQEAEGFHGGRQGFISSEDWRWPEDSLSISSSS